MTHSLLIVGGTVKKRGKIARRATLGETIVEATGDILTEFEDSAVAGTLSAGGGPISGKNQPPARVETSVARDAKFDTTILEPAEDKQSITIDQVRELQHQLSLKPYAAKFKTGIILEAQRMTVEAQNALLKTLEEPPASSVLILTAPSTKQLLPTIASRCQIVRLPAEIDLDLGSEEYKKGAEEFLQLLQSGRGERLAWAETNRSQLHLPSSILHLLDIWISVLRDLLLLNSGCPSLTLYSFKPFPPFKPFDSSNSKQDKSIALCSSVLLAQKTKNLISSTNASPRLALEVLLLDLPLLTNP